MVRMHVLGPKPAAHPHEEAHLPAVTGSHYNFSNEEARAREEEERRMNEARTLEARSLVTLAVANRLSRLDKDNEELRRMVANLKRHALKEYPEVPHEAGHEGLLVLQRQSERIAQT